MALRETPVSVLKEPEPEAGICVLINTEENEEQEGHGVLHKIQTGLADGTVRTSPKNAKCENY